jgi:hypothetical protein
LRVREDAAVEGEVGGAVEGVGVVGEVDSAKSGEV